MPASVSHWLYEVPCGLPALEEALRFRVSHLHAPVVREGQGREELVAVVAEGHERALVPQFAPLLTEIQAPGSTRGWCHRRCRCWPMRSRTPCHPGPLRWGRRRGTGSWLHRKAVPPPFMRQVPPVPISLMPVMTVSEEAGQVAPPSAHLFQEERSAVAAPPGHHQVPVGVECRRGTVATVVAR